MLSPWTRSTLAMAARGLVLLVLAGAMLYTPPPEHDGDSPSTVEVSDLVVTPATARVRPGEWLGIRVQANGIPASHAALLVDATTAGRKPLGTNGATAFGIEMPATGPVTLGAEFYGADGRLLLRDPAVAIINPDSPPRIRVIAPQPSSYAASLREGGWTLVEQAPADFEADPVALTATSLLVLDNVATTDLADTTWARIETAVRRQAMGLLVLGGPRSFGLGGYRDSRLESLLPVVSEPPDDEPPASVLFLVDASGSMDRPAAGADRLQVARQAVAGSASALRPRDRVGLMSFAIEPDLRLALESRPAHAEAIEQAFPGSASGGTRLVPAMLDALAWLEADASEQDLLVVLTDANIDDAELGPLADALASTDVEVIALVVEAAERPATSSGLTRVLEEQRGRVIPVRDVLNLPVLMRASVERSRPAVVAATTAVQVAEPASWLPEGEWAPIDGYLVTRPTDDASVHIVSEGGDVIVASRVAGAGRVVAVTSGFSSWSRGWLESALWPDLAAGLAGHLATRDSGTVEVRIDDATGDLTMDGSNRGDTAVQTATVISPSGAATALRLEPQAPGRTGATLELKENGEYLLAVSDDAGTVRHRFVHRVPPAKETDSPPEPKSPETPWLLLAGLFGFLAVLWWERR